MAKQGNKPNKPDEPNEPNRPNKQMIAWGGGYNAWRMGEMFNVCDYTRHQPYCR